MSNTIYVYNPKDGTDTWATFKLYSSADSYASVVATGAIDLTTRNQFSPGYTTLLDLNGESDTSYKVKLFTADGNTSSEFSDVYLAGESDIMLAFRKQLRDTDKTVFTDTELKDMQQRAVDNLFPSILKEEVDTSNTIVAKQIDYDLPVGCFRITQVYKGALADNDWEELDEFDMINGNTLRLPENDVSTGGDVLTIYYKSAYRNIGEVPASIATIVLYEMYAEAYELLSNDRGVKFKAYATQTRDTDVRPELFQDLSNRFRSLALARKQAIERG